MIENKFHTIHFTGCSFTEGGGFEDGKHRLKLEYKNRYGFLYKNEKDVSYPSLLQSKLNLKIINDAKSGSGIERTIRKIWEYIRKNKIEDVKKTLFILEIAEAISRLEVFSNKYNRYLVANVQYDSKSGKITDTQTVLNWIYGPQMDEEYRDKTREVVREYSTLFINPIEYDKKIQNEILGLFTFFKMHDIHFYYSGNVSFIDNFTKKIYKDIDETNRLTLVINGKIQWNFYEFAHSNLIRISDEVGEHISTDGHPGFQSHQMWANGIYNFLQNKYLDNTYELDYRQDININKNTPTII
jgi:hypothetical protein